MESSRLRLQAWLTRARDWSRAECLAAAVCALSGAGLLVWAWRLWPQWRENPDLSHGFFALPLVVLLWRSARADAVRTVGPRCFGGGVQALLVAALGAGLLIAALLATVYAVALGWSAVPTLFFLGAVMAGIASLALVLAAGPGVRWIRAGWPALVLPLVILLSAPLPPGTYLRLTLSLQEMITAGVVDTLRLIGIPAMRSGNVINLGHTAVGVEEACSGVRSLISCVLAGLVLSALMLRSPARRAVLVLAAAPLALITNFGRSLVLTLLARNGVDISGAWHDGLGFAVLGVTTALLGWIAVSLEEPPVAVKSASSVACAKEGSGVLAEFVGRYALVCVAVTLGWFVYVVARTEANAPLAGPAPALERIIPVAPADAGWAVATRTDLDRFADILLTEHLLERVYQRAGSDGRLVQITVYAAWWPAGAASVSTVAAHTPEACWPGAGWVLDQEGSRRRGLPLSDGRVAGEAEQRVFVRGGYPQRVWFWHLVGGEPFRPFQPLSWRDQLAVFFKHGVRRDAPQAFVRISSNREWEELADEPLVAEVLAGFAQLGVPVDKVE
jgi:exosortase